MCVQDLAIARRTYAKVSQVDGTAAGVRFAPNPDRVAVSVYYASVGEWQLCARAGVSLAPWYSNYVQVGAVGADAVGLRSGIAHVRDYGPLVTGEFFFVDPADASETAYVVEHLAMPALAAAVKREVDKLEQSTPD